MDIRYAYIHIYIASKTNGSGIIFSLLAIVCQLSAAAVVKTKGNFGFPILVFWKFMKRKRIPNYSFLSVLISPLSICVWCLLRIFDPKDLIKI